jgi:hypothetical protein
VAKRKSTNNDLQNIHIKLRSSNTNPTKIWGELRCSGRVSSFCSTSGTNVFPVSYSLKYVLIDFVDVDSSDILQTSTLSDLFIFEIFKRNKFILLNI